MNELFDEFAVAYSAHRGYAIAATLSPVAPPDRPSRLMEIWRSTDSHNVKGDVKHFLKASTNHRCRLDPEELNGWADVFVAYWKALGHIIAGEEGRVSLGLRESRFPLRQLT